MSNIEINDIIGLIENVFSIIGVISTVYAFFRYLHNNKCIIWNDDIKIKDYPNNFDVETAYMSPQYSKIWDDNDSNAVIIVFQPENCVVRKVVLFELAEYNSDKWTVIERYKNVTPDTPICFKTERAECISRYKLKWYVDYGAYAEHEFGENTRNGINGSEGMVYCRKFWTRVREIIDWK